MVPRRKSLSLALTEASATFLSRGSVFRVFSLLGFACGGGCSMQCFKDEVFGRVSRGEALRKAVSSPCFR